MALTKDGNVLIVDTTGEVLTGPITVESVLYVPGTGTPSASIAGKSGNTMWTSGANATTRIMDANIKIRDQDLLTVTIAGTSSKLYLYLAIGK